MLFSLFVASVLNGPGIDWLPHSLLFSAEKPKNTKSVQTEGKKLLIRAHVLPDVSSTNKQQQQV